MPASLRSGASKMFGRSQLAWVPDDIDVRSLAKGMADKQVTWVAAAAPLFSLLGPDSAAVQEQVAEGLWALGGAGDCEGLPAAAGGIPGAIDPLLSVHEVGSPAVQNSSGISEVVY